jgi:mannose-6-phosphate isomerase-like protein (cupin superfamily)
MGTDGDLGIRVAAHGDRFGRERKVFGVMPFTVKVAAQDSDGRFFVIEQDNPYPGGPPRHVHHEQDEWFYAVRGSYMVEVGGEMHRLGPGDAVFAPRGVPHGWALDGAEPGRLLIAFQPAGAMEAFFDAACELPDMPSPADAAPLFEAHGMSIVGPPLRTP